MVGIIVVNLEGILIRLDFDNLSMFVYVIVCKILIFMVNNVVWDIDF